ncbi:MAG: hypothetical protein LBC03_03440 [Nitrososphaerota archaeon]|jgi:hypothetical protein|nr:hypothetical protein [Nitrososphaerota archaeon]
MVLCDVCGITVPYNIKCNHCGGYFCQYHHNKRKHHCPNTRYKIHRRTYKPAYKKNQTKNIIITVLTILLTISILYIAIDKYQPQTGRETIHILGIGNGTPTTNTIKLTIKGGEMETVTINGNKYCFMYIQKGTSGVEEAYFSCFKPDDFFLSGILFGSYTATRGAEYNINIYGESIKVKVVNLGTELTLNITPN